MERIVAIAIEVLGIVVGACVGRAVQVPARSLSYQSSFSLRAHALPRTWEVFSAQGPARMRGLERRRRGHAQEARKSGLIPWGVHDSGTWGCQFRTVDFSKSSCYWQRMAACLAL